MVKGDNGNRSLNVLALYFSSMQIPTEIKEVQLLVRLCEVC